MDENDKNRPLNGIFTEFAGADEISFSKAFGATEKRPIYEDCILEFIDFNIRNHGPKGFGFEVRKLELVDDSHARIIYNIKGEILKDGSGPFKVSDDVSIFLFKVGIPDAKLLGATNLSYEKLVCESVIDLEKFYNWFNAKHKVKARNAYWIALTPEGALCGHDDD